MVSDRHKNQFVKTDFDLLGNQHFLKIYRSKYILYLLIRRYVIREHFEGDLGLYENYWKRGVLASTKSLRWLAERLGYRKYYQERVRQWIKTLEQEGLIQISGIDVGRREPQNVFILGTHNSGSERDYREYYFIDKQMYNQTMTEFSKVSGLTKL